MEILLVSKIVSMLCLGLVTWIVGVLPLLGVRMGWLSRSETEQRHKTVVILSCMMSFGGGVILTSCLTHMLPDVNEVLQEALDNNTFPDSGLPVAEIFVLAGFLMIYLLEEVVHLILVLTGNLKPDGAGGHGHSHEHLEVPIEEGIQATARGFLVVLALSIHDFFEGIALGVCKRATSVWFLLLAFASHKWVISGTLGLNWARSPVKAVVSMLYMTVFCGISPVGVAVGMALKQSGEDQGGAALIVFQGLATGSLLYVVFFEILEKERKKAVPGVLQALCLSLGYIFMVCLGLAEVKSDKGLEDTTPAMYNVGL
eukprot:TRINITY_DN54438_c0_g1_i1.p1 TRINITY_DN54438_c0_g1~~TRINITY_DN54438_c0_g1_i1.p1  ORF type:complete len:314 (+),score=93.11 TRINITY_DN54438_c0_g1_i1:71-1012(+)